MKFLSQLTQNDFYALFQKESPTRLDRLIGISVFSGAVNAVLMTTIIAAAQKAQPNTLNFRYFALFGLSMVALVWSRRYAQAKSAEVSEEIVTRVRERIVDKLRNSQFILYEKFGRSPIYATLSKDALAISQAGSQIASAFSSLIVLVASGLFVAYISTKAFYLLALAVTVGVVTCQTTGTAVRQDLERSSEQEKTLLDLLSHFLDGFKETRINRARSEDLFDHYFRPASREAKRLKLKTAIRFGNLGILVNCFFYGVVAAVIFLMPSMTDINTASVIRICTVILFILGPLTDVVGVMPVLAQATVAARNLAQLEQSLASAANGRIEVAPVALAKQMVFETLSCQGVTFAYGEPNGGKSFLLGPIDLSVRRGEILFIVGGNGSGKSTLLKVLAGLYYPDAGRVCLDQRPMTENDYPRYRNLISTIFTDFHLFDRLYGIPEPATEEIERLLELLGLESRITVTAGKFNTLNLSNWPEKAARLVGELP